MPQRVNVNSGGKTVRSRGKRGLSDSSGKGQYTDFLVHPTQAGIEKVVSHRNLLRVYDVKYCIFVIPFH